MDIDKMYDPGTFVTPNLLRAGDRIVEHRNKSGKIKSYVTVKVAVPCAGDHPIKGMGKTHVNGTLCYDNIATVNIV